MSAPMHLTDDDRSFISNALRVAAEQYDRDASTVSEAGQPRLADQFTHQADKARAYAAQFDND